MDTTKKVLILEDEPIFEKTLRARFEKLGVQVFSAPNGEIGLMVAEKERPQLVMTDLMMPVMDGFEFMDKLRALNEWGKDVPVFVLTNKGDVDSMSRTMSGGVHYFVKADVDPGTVVDEAAKVLKI